MPEWRGRGKLFCLKRGSNIVNPAALVYGEPRRHDLVSWINKEVVPRIPAEHWTDTDRELPLHRNPSSKVALVGELDRHWGATPLSSAVYTLECRYDPNWKRHAAEYLSSTLKTGRWSGVEDARRLIYVGRTVDPAQQIHNHAHRWSSDGADFTQVFEPVRVLDIAWCR
jgi:hypothetical protein